MAIKNLPMWLLTNGLPAYEDTESSTALEQTYRLYQKMNELIDNFNEFTENMDSEFANFKNEINGDLEVFATSLRQEFQDFIDVINLKILEIEQTLENRINEEVAVINETINTAKQTAITTSKNYTDEEVATAITTSKNYTDQEVATAITTSKHYTDMEIIGANNYIKQEIAKLTPKYTNVNIESIEWVESSEYDPYQYVYTAGISADVLTTSTTLVELINDQPVAFAKYGISILSVDKENNTITFGALKQPEEDYYFTLRMEG